MIVFSDMDGTLLTSDKQMSDATWAMLDELARRGIEFVPCTGRPLSGIFEPILAHPAVHYAVCANGASVWQLDDDVSTDASRATCVLSRPLDCGIAHRIHRIAASHDVTFDIFADGQCFLPRSLYERLDEFCGGDPHIAASLKRTRTPIDMDIDSKIDEVETLERIAMYWHDPADRDAIAAELDTLEGIEVTRSYAMNIEVMGEGATKGTALTWLCEHLGELPADAWAFGDNINDIPMLQAAGLETGGPPRGAEYHRPGAHREHPCPVRRRRQPHHQCQYLWRFRPQAGGQRVHAGGDHCGGHCQL